MNFKAKEVLVLLQLTGLFSSSLEDCQNKGLRYSSYRATDQWWTNPNEKNIILGLDIRRAVPTGYRYTVLCSETYFKGINITGDEDSVLEINNIKELTLYFRSGTIFKFGAIKMNNTCVKSIKEDAFTNFVELQEINLKQNHISSLPEQLFATNFKLKSIDLSYNNISVIGNTTFCTNPLLNLNLKHNKLQSLNFKLPNTLMNLELSSNLISQIPSDIFFGLTTLRTLLMENNHLKTLPVGCFKDLHKLNVLSLAENTINRTFSPHAGIFTGLKEINTLNFSRNSLQDITGLITQSLGNVEILDVSNNYIHLFDTAHIRSLRRLHVISINNNIFNCSYLNKVLIEFAEKGIVVKEGHVYSTENIKGIACTEENESKIKKEVKTQKEEELDKAGKEKQGFEKEVVVPMESTLNTAQYLYNNGSSVKFQNLITSRINAALVIVTFCFILLLGIVVTQLITYLKNNTQSCSSAIGLI